MIILRDNDMLNSGIRRVMMAMRVGMFPYASLRLRFVFTVVWYVLFSWNIADAQSYAIDETPPFFVAIVRDRGP
jgi:hypothetical protein